MAIVDTLLGAGIGLGASLITLYARERISERSRKSIEIYEPLYNEIKPASNGNLPVDNSGDYRSTWESVEEWKRYQTDNDLIRHLDRYSNHITNLRQLKSQSDDHRIEWLSLFPDSMVHKENRDDAAIATVMNTPVDEQDWIPIDDLVDDCYTVLLSEQDSAGELEEAMRNELRGNLRNRMQSWSSANSDWAQYTLEQTQSVDSDSHIGEQRESYLSAVQDAKKVRSMLESKIGRLPV